MSEAREDDGRRRLRRRPGAARMRIRLRHERLADAIDGSSLSQNRWAQRLGLSRGHLSMLVNGKRPYPEPETRRKLLDGLDLQFEDLFVAENPWVPERLRGWRRTFRGLRSAPREPTPMNRAAAFLSGLLQDLAFAFRSLRRGPAFTTVAVLALALGIGANTAIFSVIDAVLLQPLPFPEPDELVMVWETNRPRERPRNVISPANFLDWRDRNESFRHLAAIAVGRDHLTGVDDPEEVAVHFVTPDFFSVLGVEARIGRTFTAEEGEIGGPLVAVLSHGFWRRRFGADREIVGDEIELDGEAYTVIGVMPPAFVLSVDAPGFGFFSGTAEVWRPLRFGPEHRQRTGRFLMALARLRKDVGLERATAEMAAIAERLEEERPEANAGWGVNLVPLREQVVGHVRPALLVLLGAVGFLLLIACANVANVLLARAADRRREVAIRASLGASRGRLVRQLLTESMVLAAIGGGAGLLLAWLGTETLVRMVPSELWVPHLEQVGFDGRVLGFTASLSVLTGLVFGLAPAATLTATRIQDALKVGGRGGDGATASRIRSGLVVTEVALAMTLLIGAGLLIRSFASLTAVDPGFGAERVLTARIMLPSARYGDDEARTAFFRRLIERSEALPGVEAVGGIHFLPLAGIDAATSFWRDDRPEPSAGEKPITGVRFIAGDYLDSMGIPVRRGRTFDSRDAAGAPAVVIVNDTLVRRFFPGEDPIGKRIVYRWDEDVTAEIVGVVGSVRHGDIRAEPGPELYRPFRQDPQQMMSVAIRTSTDPAALAPSFRDTVHELDPDLPVADLAPLETVLSESVAPSRFNMMLLGVLAAIAVLLAAVGVYGVMAHLVGSRTREIGIRIALGARAVDVVRMVVGKGMLLTLVGIAIGLGGAILLSRSLSGLLYGIEPSDPATYGATAGLLILVALAANLWPAVRATRVDPVRALESE